MNALSQEQHACDPVKELRRQELESAGFTAKEVAQAVKVAYCIGQSCDWRSWPTDAPKRFDAAALSSIAAIAGLSNAQASALYHELG